MTLKSDIVKTRVPSETRSQFEAVAEGAGLTVSSLLRLLIEGAVEGAEVPVRSAKRASKTRREGKVTVRLASDVRESLGEEARQNGVSVSTWAAALLAARMRDAPQPVKGERRDIQAAYRQLRGLAVNANQIAYALNKGVLTGAGADLTRDEVSRLREDVADLRQALGRYAEGRYAVQCAQGTEKKE